MDVATPVPSSEQNHPESSSSSTRAMDPTKLVVVVKKLVDSLEAIKTRRPTNTTNVTMSLRELDDLITRSQQIARLTDSVTSTSSVVAIPRPPAQAAPPVLEVERSKSFYFADGNVALFAFEGRKNVVFRVHQSILSLHSPVFASMFTLPPPNDPSEIELYDGVPLVRMYDHASDLSELLRALYDPNSLPYKRHQPQEAHRLLSILGIASKYEMDDLRTRLTDYFASDWPTSLDEWDCHSLNEDRLRNQHDAMWDTDTPLVDGLRLDDRLPEPVSAICVASFFNIPDILPAAYYQLLKTSIRKDWYACRAAQPALFDFDTRTAMWGYLPLPAFHRLLLIRETLDKSLEGMADELGAFHGCSQQDVCEKGTTRVINSWRVSKDPLKEMKKYETANNRHEWEPHGVCKRCWTGNHIIVPRLRRLLWSRLTVAAQEEGPAAPVPTP